MAIKQIMNRIMMFHWFCFLTIPRRYVKR